jgi:hypothetical protein
MSSLLDRRGADHLDGKFHLVVSHARDVAHKQPRRRLGYHRTCRGITQKQLRRSARRHRHIEQRPVARRRIVPPPAHAFKDCVAVEPLCQETREPAVAAEE